MTEQEKEEMLKDRKELAKKKSVSYLEVYCGNCEHGKSLYGGLLCCEFLFNHSVEEYSYCEEWTKRKDVVEVVRCRDCAYYEAEVIDAHASNCQRLQGGMLECKPDSYCSDGVPKWVFGMDEVEE